MRKPARSCLMLAAILVILSARPSDAQWVFLARQGVKIINSLTSPSQSPGQAQGAEAATVILDANADKVYNAAVKLLRENPDFKILWQEDAKRSIGFSKGEQAASMKVSSLNDNLSQILVASTPGKPSGTSLVVEGILRVCKQMDVECSHAQD
jgi:hypothetical protein